MIDDSVLEGDEDAKKKVKNQQWELVKEVLFGKVDEEKARKQDAAERRKERRRRKAAERAKQEAEMTVPQCLAQLLLDDDEHVVERAVKAVGAMLQGLRDAGGRRQPQEAERRMLLNARKIAGPLYRLAGLYSARKLPEHGEDEDAALKNTFDKKGATITPRLKGTSDSQRCRAIAGRPAVPCPAREVGTREGRAGRRAGPAPTTTTRTTRNGRRA